MTVDRHPTDRDLHDFLMPLHVAVATDGLISHVGPTLARMQSSGNWTGARFFERFALIRPGGITTMVSLRDNTGKPLRLRSCDHPDIPFRGVAMSTCNSELIINLSFGIAVVDAVRRFGLTNEDFAPTDLALELLYLMEAKSAAFEESRRLNRRLNNARTFAETQAQTDALTGLSNRRALDRMLVQSVATGDPFALMQIDLDYFKTVNDQLGHAAGDEVLRRVAKVLVEETRHTDSVVRIGGDEFLIILRGPVDTDTLTRIADRLVDRVQAPIAVEGDVAQVSVSIGMTLSTLYERPDYDRMMRDSDAALYVSKQGGRSRATMVSSAAFRDTTQHSTAPGAHPFGG